jgi:hypothetical protein
VTAHVQPDQGTVCAYWVAVLVTAIGSSKDTCCVEFQLIALRHLLLATYVYTGNLVPSRCRTHLVDALCAPCEQFSTSQPKGMSGHESVHFGVVMALGRVLMHDAEFAQHRSKLHILRRERYVAMRTPSLADG